MSAFFCQSLRLALNIDATGLQKHLKPPSLVKLGLVLSLLFFPTSRSSFGQIFLFVLFSFSNGNGNEIMINAKMDLSQYDQLREIPKLKNGVNPPFPFLFDPPPSAAM